ncbi:hypothetical protein RM844_30495 [Streptomyces sp. DSM 44915]|uniref:Replicative helicase inhibitor G39P N-terminal domain-containing protein n=1 Tax=Streptomyces chisholmiae TaxID=3075540 RepID=A0ABU2K029_9ACTN|nr:hypothetical protein [Streptomyces sp. DSM 44915]MDT0270611.1 hypothetical protein [Streptomyces sp. DSM 44915]
MTPDETVVLARYVRALCPQQRFDEFTPDAWHDVLSAYDLPAARRAAATVAGRQPFVSPSEIIAEIRRQRANAAADYVGPGLTAEVPDADPDDVTAYLAALRGQRTRAASGLERPRPVAQLLGGVGRAVPAPRRAPGPMSIPCPRCQAPLGTGCRLPSGRPRGAGPHRERATAAQQRWDAAS